ncbi:hypothetical protein [Rhodococcus erythropolis]|uniref:hypothetical protein n=1 Tax=Rhodococcus erythropolis TaxID=1833 RepID=UPI00374E2AB5
MRADIYRPATEGAFPELINRTPYEKGGMMEPRTSALKHELQGTRMRGPCALPPGQSGTTRL